MYNNDIISIIEELKALRIREIQVLSDLEAAVRDSLLVQGAHHPRTNTTPTGPSEDSVPNIVPAPSNDSTNPVIKQTRASSSAPSNDASSSAQSNEEYNKGDRVIIVNRITRFRKNLPSNHGDRIAIVTGIAPNKVYIRTLNGLDTWRIPKNLRHYSHDE
jgi:hypothetical protein